MKNCPFCRTQNRDNAVFCKNCGRRVVSEEEVKVLAPEQTESPNRQKIEIVLNELESWKRDSLIAESNYKTLKNKYQAQLATIKARELLQEADLLYKQWKWDEAIAKAKEALSFDSKLTYAHLLIGRSCEASDRLAEAYFNYQEALKIEPHNQEIQKLLIKVQAGLKAKEEKEKLPKEPAPSLKEEPPTKVEELPIRVEAAPQPPPPEVPLPREPGFDWASYFDSFLEKRGLNWWYMVGAFILLAGIIGLITWQWGLLGKYAIFAILFFLTAGMYLVGKMIVERLRLGGLAIISVASLLVPTNFFTFNAFKILGTKYDWNYVGIIAAFTCGVTYVATTYWLEEGYFVYFASVAFAALLHFILQAAGVQYFYYGLFLIPLAGIYMFIAYYFYRMGNKVYSFPLFVVANAISVIALGSTAFLPRFFYAHGINNTVIMLFMAFIIYFISAYLFNSNVFVYISSVLVLSFAFLLFYKNGINWYSHGLYFMLFGCFFLGLGATNQSFKRQRFAQTYFIQGIVVATAVFLAFFGKGLIDGIWEHLSSASSQELISALITTFLGSAIYATVAYFLRKRTFIYLSSGIFVYFFFVALALANVRFVYYPFFLSLILCPLILIIGGLVERFSERQFGFPLYVVGYSVAVVASLRATYAYLIYWYFPKVLTKILLIPISVNAPVSDIRVSTMWTMLVLTVILVVSAHFFRKSSFEYPAIACGLFFYGIMSSLILAGIDSNIFLIKEKNFGFYFIPLVILLTVAGYLFKLVKKEAYANPYLQASFVVALVSLAGQANYIINGFKFSVSATFLFYSVLFAVAAVIFRRDNFLDTNLAKAVVLTYLSALTFTFGFTHLLYHLKVSFPQIGLYLSIASALWFVVGYGLLKIEQKLWVQPIFNSSVGIGLIAAIFASLKLHPFSLVVVAIVAILYSLITGLLNEKEAAFLAPFYFFLIYMGVLKTVPEANYVLYAGFHTGVLLIFTFCFAVLAWKFKSYYLSYTSSITLPFAYLAFLSIWLHNTNHPAYYAGGLLLISPIFLFIGYGLSKTSQGKLAQAPYIVGYAISLLSIVASLGFYLNLPREVFFYLFYKSGAVEKNIAIFSTVFGSILYGISAYSWRRKEFVYPSVITAAIAYPIIGSATFVPTLYRNFGIERNYGLYFVLFVIAAFGIGLILEHYGRREYGTPLSYVTFMLAIASIVSQQYYFDISGFRWSVVSVLLIYAILFTFVAYLRREEKFTYYDLYKAELFTYLACFNFFTFFMLLLPILKVARVKSLFWAIFISIAFYGLSLVMLKFKKEQFERPLFVSSFFVLVIINLLSFYYLTWSLAVYNILLVTISFGLLAVMGLKKDILFIYGAFVLYALFNFHFFNYLEFPNHVGFLAWLRSPSAIVVAIICGLVTAKIKRQEINYYGLTSLTYGVFLAFQAFNLPTKYYPYYFIPYVFILLAFSYFLDKQAEEVHSQPCKLVAFLVTLITIIIPIMLGHRQIAIVVMASYSVIYGVAAISWRSIFFTYFSPSLFTFGYLYTLYTWPKVIPWTVAGFVIMLLGVAWFGLGYLIYWFNKEFSYPLIGLSLGVSSAAIAISLTGAYMGHRLGVFAVYTMLLAGALFATKAFAFKKHVFGHLSFLSFLVAFYLPLLDRELKVIDAYLIPVGLYLIALGFIYKKHQVTGAFVNVLFVCGLVTVLGSTLISSVEKGGAIHAVLLLVESIVSIFIGISLRKKAFLFLGTVFLVANGLVQFWKPLTSVHWAVYATLAGIIIIATGILFERKREQLIAKGQQVLETLREWD